VFYGGREVLELAKFPLVQDWVARAAARPASVVGLNTPKRD
jgi:GST-like protein